VLTKQELFKDALLSIMANVAQYHGKEFKE
jgi:hypothetical protein